MDGAPLTAPCLRLPDPLTHVTVAIPVRNEADRIPALLASLAEAARLAPLPVGVVILANNCTDASVSVARAFAHPALEVSVRTVTFQTPEASAGRARRVAMDLAARPGALLMTTDADALPQPRWIAVALEAVRCGADLVCGAISCEVPHVLATPSGARITRAEEAYADLQHQIRHCIDQMAGRQPLGAPRPHYMESGASMAIRADRYLAVGGLPRMDHSEDRAMVHRAEADGLSVRYVSEMQARVSARLQGRADGGMAACLRHRMQDHDPLADQAMLPPGLLGRLWAEALAGDLATYPCRSLAPARHLRASDLEAGL
ncbi:glycosyltransferase, partial [Paracoccus liaowanqingii]